MKKVMYFLSGDLVRDLTQRILNGWAERIAEPICRRKAWRNGYGAAYEAWLIVFRQKGADNAPIRAYKLAKIRCYPEL